MMLFLFLLLSSWIGSIVAPPTCPAPYPVNIKAPRENLWKPLSQEETWSIEKWLFAQNLNLTTLDTAKLSDNTIYLIELLTPNKTDVLPYIDTTSSNERRSSDPIELTRRQANSGPPARYARVILYMGGLPIPVVKEITVGPLPISNSTTYAPLSYLYQNSTVPGVEGSGVFPFNSRFTTSLESDALYAFILSFTTPLQDVTMDLFGGVYTGSGNDTLTYSYQGPSSFDGNFRRFWLFFVGRGTGAQFLSPVGWFVYVDLSGTDPSKWFLKRIVYNHQVFNSVDEFRSAWANGTLKKGVKADIENTKWAERNRKGTQRSLDDRKAPQSTFSDGSRIKADRDAGYVEWLGWSFWTGFNRDTGVTLWDIRFKGERLIYEISLQEAVAQYAGNDPVQSTTAYLDRHYGIGSEVTPALSGYDCPHQALKLNATYWTESTYHVIPDAICIFELDLGFPTSRHADTTGNWYGATKGTALHIRTMATVYNYDYMFDYILYLEGTIEIRVAASGYLQATYWDDQQANYGTRIEKTTMGSIHSHVLNYKVDLDIQGTSNSLLKTDLVQEEVTLPWSDPEDGVTRQLRADRQWISTESAFDLGNNGQTIYTIGNKNALNAWGYPKSYRIMPGYHTSHNAVVGSQRLLNNARWGEHDLFVLRHKDTEIWSSSTWNQHLPVAPPIDFSKYLEPAEEIDQQDLVVYINVGMHHLPRAEDTPNTLFTDTRSSFFFSPFNYFDDEPSRDITNAILLQGNSEGQYEVAEGGTGDDEQQCLLQSDPMLSYIDHIYYDAPDA
ncbi:hypothetical protein FRC02_006181 [Tulasnella sp. 418]|nr:hypothetical protein FRC02_006181 [Tulasnella sp. 418]